MGMFSKPLGQVVILIYNLSESRQVCFPVLCSKIDCEFRFDLFSKGHRKDSDKSRSRKDDDSLAEASHSKKTVKKAGNGVIPKLVLFCNGVILLFFPLWFNLKLSLDVLVT